MTLFEWIQTVTSIVTAIGVGIAARQLYLSKQQEQAQFEDSFTEQYRQISSRLPLDAFLGKPLTEADLVASLRGFYEYFDLSNEQAFLASHGRLRPETWSNWREGIEQHLKRAAFEQAWLKLAPHLDGSFDDLRKLLPSMQKKEMANGPGPASLPQPTAEKRWS